MKLSFDAVQIFLPIVRFWIVTITVVHRNATPRFLVYSNSPAYKRNTIYETVFTFNNTIIPLNSHYFCDWFNSRKACLSWPPHPCGIIRNWKRVTNHEPSSVPPCIHAVCMGNCPSEELGAKQGGTGLSFGSSASRRVKL